jgi:ATP-dependent RNA helicase MRH4
LKLPKSYVSKIKDEEGRRTSTPIGQVASVAAEVADTAARLDEVRLKREMTTFGFLSIQ